METTDPKTSTIEALRAEFARARAESQATEMRSAAVAYYRLRAEQRGTRDQVAEELGVSQWTLAKWWGRMRQEQGGSVSVAEDGARLKEEINGVGPRKTTRRYPEALKRRIMTWARVQRAKGVSAKSIEDELGIPWTSLAKWIGLRRSKQNSRAILQPVVVTAPTPGPSGRLRSPSGFIVEGLDLEGMAELLRRLG